MSYSARSDEFSPTPDEDQQLATLLLRHEASQCPTCAHPIWWGDIAWNNRSTGEGTSYCTIEIECVCCYTEIVRVKSWYPSIDDPCDILKVLEGDW